MWRRQWTGTRATQAAVLAGTLTAACPLLSFAQDEPHAIREFTESSTWRVPPSVTHVIIEMWGAGGGGAGGASTVIGGASAAGGSGGGGGSGAYLRASMGVKPGETYVIKVGAGGESGRGQDGAAAQPGLDGEDTSIARDGVVLLLSRGGRGGGAPRLNDLRGGLGGAGAAADPSAVRLVRRGRNGAPGRDGGFAESYATPGGAGGSALSGSVQPSGSFGGDGGAGMHPGEAGKPGGSGSVLITW